MTDWHRNYTELSLAMRDDGVLQITFDRPETMNSIDRATHTELTRIWLDIDNVSSQIILEDESWSSAPIDAVAIEGRRVIASYRNGSLRRWDIEREEHEELFRARRPLTAVSVSSGLTLADYADTFE